MNISNSPSIEDDKNRSDQERFAATGIAGLDALLGGGFRRNHSFLIQGASGSGKTTMGLQFVIHGAQRGERVLHIGTSESLREIHEVAESHGWSLEGVTLHHHAQPETQPSGLGQTVFHAAEVELPRTIDSIISIIKQVDPSRLVLDSLSEIRVLAKDERLYRQQLMVLKEFLADRECTALLLDDRLGEQMLLRSLVNGVVELEQNTSDFGPDNRRLRIAKLRGQSYPTGYHDFRIVSGGLSVFPRLVAAEHRTRFEPQLVSSGLPELDALMGGGFDRGTTALLLGPSGTGKSSVAAQCVVAAARRGERSVMYVFDERLQTLFQRSRALGIDLEEHVDSGMVLIHQIDPAELTAGEFAHIVREATENNGIQMAVIDSLTGFMYSMPQERFLMLHMHELLSYLNQKAVTSLVVATEHGLLGPSRSRIDVSYVADTVILFRNFEDSGAIRNVVSVYKKRGGEHERTLREMRLGPERITVGQPIKDFRGVLAGSPEFMGKAINGEREVT